MLKKQAIKPIFFSLLIISWLYTLTISPQQLVYAQDTPDPVDRCVNMIANGNMEEDGGWRLSVAPMPARYVNAGRNDSQALQIGPTSSPDARGLEWSSALQEISVPATDRAILSLWYRVEQGSGAANDRNQIALLDQDFEVLDFLLTEIEPSDTWQSLSVDISEYAGESIQLFFGVKSNGATGSTYLYIDDVELCDAQRIATSREVTPEPTAMRITLAQPTRLQPEATATPEPTVAVEIQPEPTEAVDDATTSVLTTPVTTTNETTVQGNTNAIPFHRLRIPDIRLNGPFDTVTIRFSLPAHWQPDQEATLQLELSTFLADADGNVDTEALRASGAALGVAINGTVLRSVPLDTFGQNGANVPIPVSALRSPQADGRHELQIVLGGGPVCMVDRRLGVVINANSQIIVPHEVVALPTDLTLLPRPIFQDAIAPDQAMIVVPDTPTPDELQTVLSVAAGFGRMTDGKLDLTLVTAGDLTSQMRNENHLILVGTAATMPLLETLPLPAPAGESAFAIDGAAADDGIVQMINSPWNAEKAILIVSGDSDVAVRKAGQAVSGGIVRVGTPSNLALVAQIRPDQHSGPINVNRSLADLGYSVRTIAGSSEQTIQYEFALPDRQAITGDAYLNLIFNHAATIDYTQSSATIFLNDQPVRSMNFNTDSAQLNSTRVTLPRAALRSGNNLLQIRANMVPEVGCSMTDQPDVWFTVWPDSVLHTPIAAVQAGSRMVSLNDFPSPFTASAGLSDTTLVVARDDPDAWNVAAQIASYLGQSTTGTTIYPAIAYADDIAEPLRNNSDLIIIGRPDSLPIIAELGDSLLVAANTNDTLATENGLDVVYRLPQGIETGYLEVARAPWNEQHTILTVLGNSATGLQQAATTLIESAHQQTLAGSFAVIDKERIIAGDTAERLIAGAGSDTTVAAQPSQPAIVIVSRPAWVLPVIVIAILLIIGMVAYRIYISRRPSGMARS